VCVRPLLAPGAPELAEAASALPPGRTLANGVWAAIDWAFSVNWDMNPGIVVRGRELIVV
jgi:hypothetical protein